MYKLRYKGNIKKQNYENISIFIELQQIKTFK